MKNTLTIIIPAAVNGVSGVANSPTGGKYFKCLSMTGAFSVLTEKSSFDVISPGDGFGDVNSDAFARLTFYNPGAVAITVKFYVGTQPCSIATTAIGANAATYLFGSLGITNGANANIAKQGGGTQNVTNSAAGYCTIPNAVNVLIDNTNNGHRRQVLYLSIAPTTLSSIGLNVLDPNGLTIMTIPAGSPPVAIVSDSQVYVSGAGGPALVTIGEVYLSN